AAVLDRQHALRGPAVGDRHHELPARAARRADRRADRVAADRDVRRPAAAVRDRPPEGRLMLIPAVVLLGVVVGVVVGEWWAIGVALIAGAGAYAVDDVGAAVAFTLAAAAGVGM